MNKKPGTIPKVLNLLLNYEILFQPSKLQFGSGYKKSKKISVFQALSILFNSQT